LHGVFWRWYLVHYLLWLALNHDPPDLSLPSGCDYRFESLVLGQNNFKSEKKVRLNIQTQTSNCFFLLLLLFFLILLFICAYKSWVISPPCPPVVFVDRVFFIYMPPHSAQISAFRDKSSSVQPLISDGVDVASQTPVSAPQKTQSLEQRAQLPDSSDSVRQMLQDELFKLVQVSTLLHLH
jgi:hypothetical protein